MTMTELLFSFKGRIARQPWWLASLLIAVVLILLMMVTLRVSGSIESTVALAYVCYIPAIWTGLALGAKRLHDRDKSAWWLVLFYIVPGILEGAGSQTGGAIAFTLVAFGLTLWGLVELGFLRGTSGPNRYGANPLPAPDAQTQ